MHPIDHIGIAVNDIEAAIAQWRDLLGYTLLEREELPHHGVTVAFLGRDGETAVELMAPLGDQSTLAKFLATRGPGLHHICFKVSDIVAELERMKSAGTRLIDESPRPGSRNCEVAFVHPKACGGVLVELAQYRR